MKIKKKNKSKQLKIKKTTANTNANSYKNELLLSKKKEIFKNIYSERLDRIDELTKKNNYDELNFIVENIGDKTMIFLNNIKIGKLKLEEAKNLQEDFNKLLKNIQKRNKYEKEKIVKKY